jgi:hypothetical protein
MCCIVALFAWISPRFAIAMAWLFANDRTSAAFDSFWIALVGFFLLPWTTLAWIVCYAPIVGVRGFGWVVVAFAFLVDVASYTSGRRAQRDRATRTV